MDSNDNDEDNKDTVLHIIPSNQLRLIPLYAIITHIYEKIIEKAAECESNYAFNINQLIHKYELNTKIATHSNKMYIINEIKRLFPGIKITEIGEKYSAMSQYNSYWTACWEEELDDIKYCSPKQIIRNLSYDHSQISKYLTFIKKTRKNKQEDSQNDNKYNELLNYIVKENQDFKKQILEIINNKHNS